MCIISMMIVGRMLRAKANPKPIDISNTASNGRESLGWMIPKLITEMVRPAIASAGLSPGRSLRAPNQMKTVAIA